MKRKRKIGIFLLSTLFCLGLFFSSSADPQKPDHKNASPTAKVVEIYDGDTIRLANGMEVRYIGLDTPETHHPEKPVEYFGIKASEFNEELVGGKKVKLEFDVERRDKYDRFLAYVYVKHDGDWINVNAKLVKEGYARLYTKAPNVKYSDYFLELEKEARNNCRGSWRAYCEGPPVFSAKEIEEKMEKHLGKIVTVKYHVIDTHDAGDIIFLNSSYDYETDFTAVIFDDSRKHFQDEGITPEEEYYDKTIKVTGELQEYDGPEIIIYHPYQVEIVGS